MLYHVQKGILQSVALVQEHTGHKLLTNVVVAGEKVGGDFKELDMASINSLEYARKNWMIILCVGFW